jgi:hypothetical protein
MSDANEHEHYGGYVSKEAYQKAQKKYNERIKANPDAKKRRTMAMYRSYAKNYAKNADISDKDLRDYVSELSAIVEERILQRDNKS